MRCFPVPTACGLGDIKGAYIYYNYARRPAPGGLGPSIGPGSPIFNADLKLSSSSQ
jgi:hypothetical protein